MPIAGGIVNKRKPLRQEVLESVQDAIISGRYQPGDLIREIPLAQELGVSQNTIREALLQCERLGLVVRTPNRHTAVTRLSDADVAERVALRYVLEPQVAVAAAARMTEADFQELENRLRAMNDAVARNAPIEAGRADYEFHRWIWQRSGLPWVCQVLEQTSLPLFAFVSIVRNRRADTLRAVVNPHEGMVRAMRTGDAEEIVRVFREHFRNSYREFQSPGTPQFWV
jgi:DNA-binding GntR family transcriptional regulator